MEEKLIFQYEKDYLTEDYLEHYGVKGMKWGVRHDLKKYGSISDKRKKKIQKTLEKASYNKTRKLLNGVEQMKAEYKGSKEANRNHKEGSRKEKRFNKSENSLNRANELSDIIKESANKKGYQYDVHKTTRMTSKAKKNIVGGVTLSQLATKNKKKSTKTAAGVGTAAAVAGLQILSDKKHREQSGSDNSKYMVYDTDVYKKKKKVKE